MRAGNQHHLSHTQAISQGSYYTPPRFVDIARDWIAPLTSTQFTVFDPSCGYGAFLDLEVSFDSCHLIGNDIDAAAVAIARKEYPKGRFFVYNLFTHFSRSDFGIAPDERLIIVGNPPYNDTTSLIRHTTKKKYQINEDPLVRSRDLGLSSLLCYSYLKPDYCLIIHPLSYLVKKANFNVAKRFFENYSLIKSIIFSSQEFTETSKISGFPVIMGLYKRTPRSGMIYGNILTSEFKTIEGLSFRLSDSDYVCDYVDKYPSNKRYSPEILFYTMRDINALNRSRTFMKNRTAASIDVDPTKLSYYCYIDCFRRFARTEYYMGNLNVPFIKDKFEQVKQSVVAVSTDYFPEIFSKKTRSTSEDRQIVNNYIEASVSRLRKETK